MNNRRILISGAGIAGPAMAYWLLRNGFEPTLVERAPALREGGYIIDFWGIGFDVAEKMGLLPALRTDGYKFDEVCFVNARGERVGGLSTKAFQATLGERYLSLLRSDLSRRIYESLDGKVETVFEDWITSIGQDDEGARVTFKHASPRRFDLVIGAGGLHSGVRRLVFGPEEGFEHYLGYYSASFSVDGYPRRDTRAYVSYAAPGRQVSRYSLRGDRTVFFFVFARKTRLPDPHDPQAQKEVLREVFGQDGWECPAVLEALDECSDLYFDAVSQIHMDAWSRGRVALTGDACFCPSLLAGQGSALAMAGAYILAGELKKAGGDHTTAFRNYEDLFRPLIMRKQRTARQFAGSFAPKTNLGLFVRNQVTRLMTIPFVANLTVGRMLSDQLTLPLYDAY
jgi:2-polyprenyl-6-methoxyphenol hydroxylase-like FAD-dependent oxidoreductase